MVIDIHWNKWFPTDMDDMLMIRHYLVKLGKELFYLLLSFIILHFIENSMLDKMKSLINIQLFTNDMQLEQIMMNVLNDINDGHLY